MKVTIDRIENDIVVVELSNGQIFDINIQLFPDAKEGDIYIIKKNTSEKNERIKRLEEKMNRIFDK